LDQASYQGGISIFDGMVQRCSFHASYYDLSARIFRFGPRFTPPPSPSPSPIWDDPPRAANRVLQEAFYLVVAACWWGKTVIAG
jgi:hypothetical protein